MTACAASTLTQDEDGGVSVLECERPAGHEGDRHAGTYDGRRLAWREPKA